MCDKDTQEALIFHTENGVHFWTNTYLYQRCAHYFHLFRTDGAMRHHRSG